MEARSIQAGTDGSTPPPSPGAGLEVVGIHGSLRERSFNGALLAGAVEVAPEGLSVAREDSLREIPPFDDDVRQQGLPSPVAALAGRIGAADGLLIATPEYNFGVPGVLKNALDWISGAGSTPADSPLRHKPVAIMGASIGLMGTVRAQQDVRRLCHFTDSHAMLRPEVFVSRAPERFDSELRLVDEPTRELLGGFMETFRDFIAWLRAAGPPPEPRHGFAPAARGSGGR